MHVRTVRKGDGERISSRCNDGDLGIKRKDHIHLRFDLDGLTVYKVWLVLPLLHRLERSRSQHRVSANYLQVLDIPLLADRRLQDLCLAKTSYTCKMNDLAQSSIRTFPI
jgi:hypothetical protein